MTSIGKALILFGLGTLLVGTFVGAVTAYTGTFWLWVDSSAVLVGIGVLFTITGRVLLPTEDVLSTR